MSTNERVVATNVEQIDPIIPMTSREVFTVLVAGFLVGAVVAAGYYLLARYVFGAVMCRESSSATCVEAPVYAMTVAMIIGGLAGLITLAQARVYRPLLVVLAAVISLWGFQMLIGDMAWYWGTLIVAGLFALTYGLFAWIVRLRSFVRAMIIVLLLIVLLRFAFAA